MSSDRPAIRATGLRKSYGATTALAGLDLEVPEGTVRAVLGPNGAGKTTAVRVLTTLLKPDGGTAEVLGLDVVRDAQKLRASVGLTGQYAAVDEMMTGLENLEMFGRLYHLKPSTARARGAELLERFDLVDAADRLAKTYSGGMRRRLDLAASLIMAPKMLFLDEPTTGLDPRSRMAMWGVIEELVGDGTTVLLTTQYLEEADQLSDLITVIDSGRVIAEGTSDELKTQVGGQRLAVTIGRGGDLETAATALARFGRPEVTAETRMIVVPVDVDAGVLPDVIRELDAAGVPVADIALHRPTLDDVFLTLTGRRAEGDETALADETAPELVETR